MKLSFRHATGAYGILFSVISVLLGCAPKQVQDVGPQLPVFRYEQLVHNEGLRGKFASESKEVISVTLDRRKTDSTFKFTGAVLGRLTSEKREVEIVRLDRDLVWQISMNKKRYLEYPIKKAAQVVGVAADDPAGEKVYVEDCCKVKTGIKRTGAKKIVNGYDAEQVIFTVTSNCQDEPGQPPNATKITLEVWIAPSVNLADVEAFNRAYAAKIGMDIQMLKNVGDDIKRMFPAVTEIARLMKDLKGYPILSVLSVEDENYLKRQEAEQKKAGKEADQGTDTSPAGLLSGFFSKKMDERQAQQQKEENLKWGNVIWRISWESRNFEKTQIAASEFNVPGGYDKVAQKENLEGEQGKAEIVAKPAHFVRTACMSSLSGNDLGVARYPGAHVARERPYSEADHNTQWYYAGKNDYRVRFSTTDSMEKVTAFYEKALKTKCTVSTVKGEGDSYKQAVCSKPAGPGLVRTMKVSEQPLELQMEFGNLGTGADKAPEKRIGIELSTRSAP
jgi:hypothetical protein